MLHSLSLHNVRNIHSLDCRLSPRINFIVGDNGSGKSSILEAITLLGMGRSFRTRYPARVINHEHKSLTVSADSYVGRIGVEKKRQGPSVVRMNQETLPSVAEIARLLPIQLIEPHSYKILEGASKLRRQVIDWGVFHVEPIFLSVWRQSQRAIKHRNAALRQKSSPQEIKSWDSEIIRHAEVITQYRQQYVQTVFPLLQRIYTDLGGGTIDCAFYPGWNTEQSLENALEASYERDLVLGYTQHGPHRADLKFKVDGRQAIDVLSRGQQKRLVVALGLAQGQSLYELTRKSCLYLLDDITSEFDQTLSEKTLAVLSEIQSQIIITSVEPKFAQYLNGCDLKSFQIQSGILQDLN